MKSTRWGLIFTVCIFFQLALQAQSRQKAESAFLKEINNVLQHSQDAGLSFLYNVNSMLVDSPFVIKEGIISVAVSYVSDTDTIRIRAEAPVSHLNDIGYDNYLFILLKDEAVTQNEYKAGDKDYKKTIKKNLLHIGTPIKDGYGEQENLQKLLNKLLKYYKQE
ncbi:MAG: hypothetical protein H7320_03115 [Ferruginibacter sp.]|nr:hypothetical protein [Ferruginibacter sp.]